MMMECDERISGEIIQRLKYEWVAVVGAKDKGEHKENIFIKFV